MINSNKNRFEQLSFKIFSCLESLPLEKLYSPDVSEETEQTVLNMYVDKNGVVGWKIKANVLQTTLTGNEVNSFKDDYKCLRVLTGNDVKCTARFQAFACESGSFLHTWKVIFDGATSLNMVANYNEKQAVRFTYLY